jgi:hypothetical protein
MHAMEPDTTPPALVVYPRRGAQQALLGAITEALILSDDIAAVPGAPSDDQARAAQWECAEAWSHALTVAWLAAHDALPVNLHDLL